MFNHNKKNETYGFDAKKDYNRFKDDLYYGGEEHDLLVIVIYRIKL